MIEAELYDGTVLEFPDETDPTVIQSVAKRETARLRRLEALPKSMENIRADQASYAPERPLAVELGRQAGLAGRAAATGLAALPLAALEGGAGIGNLVNRAFGREGNWSPTAQFERGLDAVLPTPETGLERAVQVAGTIIAGSRTPGVPTPPPVARAPTQADRVIAAGQRAHVPVYYDDVGGAVARKVGTAAESLGPLGTGSGRAVQEKAARAAATELADKYLPSVGDDVPQLIQAGMARRLDKFRTAAGRLYARVDQAFANAGAVPTTGFRQTINVELAELQRLGSAADEGTIRLLQKYEQAPAGDFALMRALRSQLSDDIADYYTGRGAGNVGRKGVVALQKAKDALEADMAAFAQSVGGPGYRAWRSADGFYRTNIVPFKEAGFKDLIKTGEPEKVWTYLTAAGGKDSRSLRMFRALDAEGRRAVQYGLIKSALDDAMTQRGTFSPAKFASYMEKHDAIIGRFFKGAELQEVRGFTNLMRHIERAGQFAENPPTGNRLIPILLGSAAIYGPTAPVAAKVAGAGLTVRGLFQTEAGRNLLLRAGGLRPGTPEMERLSESIVRMLAATSAGVQASGAPPADPTAAQGQ